MSNRVFHTANVGVLLFEAMVTGDGPYISCEQVSVQLARTIEG